MLLDRLKPIIARNDELALLLAKDEIINDIATLRELSKEKSDTDEIVQSAREYIKLLDDIANNKLLLEDKELGELAKEELKELESRQVELENEIKILLIPKDPNDKKNIYLEIRAGTGGDEAGIFVGDLFSAYCRYADSRGWRVEIMSSSENSVGGYKEVIALVKGEGAYSRLKYEGGTHRVQRVPKTESQGRIHTSAITVAIMPEVDSLEININHNDLKIDVFRSGGHGGQSVNTTDSAVRITHIPTNTVVACQSERSQIQNRETAMRMLKSKLLDLKEQEHKEKIEELKGTQKEIAWGSQIRSYVFCPYTMVKDHRTNYEVGNVEAVMDGEIDGFIESYLKLKL